MAAGGILVWALLPDTLSDDPKNKTVRTVSNWFQQLPGRFRISRISLICPTCQYKTALIVGVQLSSISLGSMSVLLNNLDDFIAPSQACINPFVSSSSKEDAKSARITIQSDFSTSEYEEPVRKPDLIKSKTSSTSSNQKVATVSLNDCLACRLVSIFTHLETNRLLWLSGWIIISDYGQWLRHFCWNRFDSRAKLR